MAPRLTTPVLTVDPAKIHEVDTRNAESLHGMWMVFSKCADYMEEGRRLENLSWRLWTRETFCVDHTLDVSPCPSPVVRATTTTSDENNKNAAAEIQKLGAAHDRSAATETARDADVPELSTSVESESSSEELRVAPKESQGQTRPDSAQERREHALRDMSSTGDSVTEVEGDDYGTPRPMTSASTSALPSSRSTRARTESQPVRASTGTVPSNLRRSHTMMEPDMSEAARMNRALYRGREKHITPKGLERMVYSIKERKGLEPWLMSGRSYSTASTTRSTATNGSSLQSTVSTRPVEMKNPRESHAARERSKQEAGKSQPATAHTQTPSRPQPQALQRKSSLSQAQNGRISSTVSSPSAVRFSTSKPSSSQPFSPYDFSAATLRSEAQRLHQADRSSSSSGSTGLGLGLGPSVDLGADERDADGTSSQAVASRAGSEAGSIPNAPNAGVVRGFTPGRITSYRSVTSLAPTSQQAPVPTPRAPASQPAKSSPVLNILNRIPPTPAPPRYPVVRVPSNGRPQPNPLSCDTRPKTSYPETIKPALKSALKRYNTSSSSGEYVKSDAFNPQRHYYLPRPGSASCFVDPANVAQPGGNNAGSRVRLVPDPVQVLPTATPPSPSPRTTKLPTHSKNQQGQAEDQSEAKEQSTKPQPTNNATTQNDNNPLNRKKAAGMFTLGGSSAEDENSSYNSYDDRVVYGQKQKAQAPQSGPALRRSLNPAPDRRPNSAGSGSGAGSQNNSSPLKSVITASEQQQQKHEQAQAQAKAQALAQERARQQAEALAQARERAIAQQQQAHAQAQAQVQQQRRQQQAQAGSGASGISHASTVAADDNTSRITTNPRFESAISSDSEFEDDSSVIEDSDIDDDDDEWEDSVDDGSGAASATSSRHTRGANDDSNMFQRVDVRSNAQLASRGSLLTMMMNPPQRVIVPGYQPQGQGGQRPQMQASKCSPALRRVSGMRSHSKNKGKGQKSLLPKDVLQQAGGYGDEAAIASSSDEEEGDTALTMTRKTARRQPQPPQGIPPADAPIPAPNHGEITTLEDPTADQHAKATTAIDRTGASPHAMHAPTPIPLAPRTAMAHSPRTTRRNMLASELTESLRRHLLWERQQKGGAMGVANNPIANLTRRHTTHNVAGLAEYPGVGDNNNNNNNDNTETADDSDDDPYEDDFYGSEYHTKGW